MRPIQKRLLIHEIIYISEVKNGWGEVEEEKKTIKFVRVEPKKGYVQVSNGDKVVYSDIIFWDNFHSTPCKFEEKQKIDFNGDIKTIQSIGYFYDDKNLHHLEIRVI